MKLIILTASVVLACVMLTQAEEVFLIPVDDLPEYHPLRIRRAVPIPLQPVERLLEPVADSSARVQRQSGGGHHDVVDFGAHTGHHGAFGWYADYPVHSHE